MAHTEGQWTQGLPSTDLAIFLGADQFTDFAALATIPAAPTAGILFKTVPATDASKFFITPESLYLRSGMLAVANLVQEQFGTAAAQPGPSSVSGTSGPLALPNSLPTPTGANLATVKGSNSGSTAKGMQINSVSVIYQVLTLAAAAITMGLTQTTFPGVAAAPVVTNLIALAANGLPTAVAAHPTVTTVAVGAPAFIIPTVPTQVILNINITAGATGTVQFIGAVLNCSYNLN